MQRRDIAAVTGTYNRLSLLRRAVETTRLAAGTRELRIFVVDGGSTDGSLQWLAEQSDVQTIHGGLTGAVEAFNEGFSAAVAAGYAMIAHLNDDVEFVGEGALERAAEMLEADEKIGEVAFEDNRLGRWGFAKTVKGLVYANYGLVRTDAGKAVAVAQGDPSGTKWWAPCYSTYCADCEFALWMWRLGWRIHPGKGLRVRDLQYRDGLRAANTRSAKARRDHALFGGRWRAVFRRT